MTARRIGLFAAAVLAGLLLHAQAAHAVVAFNWTTVGNAGNAADPQTGRGAVAYNYRLATTEVTNAQYAEFLNAIGPTMSRIIFNLRGYYNPSMGAQSGIFDTGGPAASRFGVSAGHENKPVGLVSWYDAVRFVNWLHNGQGPADTENGAYGLVGGAATPSNSIPIFRNPTARYALPTEDEWYKAAYHNPLAGAGGGYFDYATGSDAVPASDVPTANPAAANYSFAAGSTSPAALTPVGSYTAADSVYGTFDQNGNVREWTEGLAAAPPRTRIVRGGRTRTKLRCSPPPRAKKLTKPNRSISSASASPASKSPSRSTTS